MFENEGILVLTRRKKIINISRKFSNKNISAK